MTKHSDLTKIRALLTIVSETDGSVTLSGESAALVAKAIGEVEQLRSDRDRLQRLCDKTALAAANRTLAALNRGDLAASPALRGGDV